MIERDIMSSSTALELVRPFITEPRTENDPVEVILLEEKSRIVKLLRSYLTPVQSNPDKYILDSSDAELPRVQHIGSQFAQRLIPVFTTDTPDEAIAIFKTTAANTLDEKAALTTDQASVYSLFQSVKKYLHANREDIETSSLARFSSTSRNGHSNQSAFLNNDKYQFAGRRTNRSLHSISTEGLCIQVEGTGLAALKRAVMESEESGIPVVELTKNMGILSINGFSESKLSLAVHDAIDHVFAFDQARTIGLFRKYGDFFESIGSPQDTDIFKREGEVIASLAFGMRYWEFQDGFVPLLDMNFISEAHEDALKEGGISGSSDEALEIAESLQYHPESDETASFEFMLSNYMTTLHEQRRRYGIIKQKTVDGYTELNPLRSDQLSFFFELHHHLFASRELHLSKLHGVHIALEEYLSDVGRSRVSSESVLKLRLQDGSSMDQGQQKHGKAQEWMKQNYKFSSIKETVGKNE